MSIFTNYSSQWLSLQKFKYYCNSDTIEIFNDFKSKTKSATIDLNVLSPTDEVVRTFLKDITKLTINDLDDFNRIDFFSC